MKLLHIRCRQFRNLSEAALPLSPKTTILLGNNGQGKTNLLEAVFFATTQKPLRAQRLRELIQKGEARARVEVEVEAGGAQRRLAVEVDAHAKRLSVDGKRVAKLEEVTGAMPTVAFVPDDLWAVKGSPAARRRLLDFSAAARFPAFAAEARSFQRSLKSRNRLLKERSLSQLDVWSESLARWSARLWLRRRRLLEEMLPSLHAAFAKLGPDWQPLSLDYAPAPFGGDFLYASEETLAASFASRLAALQRHDMERGYTTEGPHMDDLDIRLGSLSARAFASQGQTRAFALAWKVAEVANLEQRLGTTPTLLLDDVSSELDPQRNAFLMDFVAQSQIQVLLTTTSANFLNRAMLDNSLWYRVENGTFVAMP